MEAEAHRQQASRTKLRTLRRNTTNTKKTVRNQTTQRQQHHSCFLDSIPLLARLGRIDPDHLTLDQHYTNNSFPFCIYISPRDSVAARTAYWRSFFTVWGLRLFIHRDPYFSFVRRFSTCVLSDTPNHCRPGGQAASLAWPSESQLGTYCKSTDCISLGTYLMDSLST